MTTTDHDSTHFEFSVATAFSCTGNAKGDIEYHKWFMTECERRLNDSAQTIAAATNGSPFAADAVTSVQVAHAEIRRCTRYLQQCIECFELKPEIATPYIKLQTKYARLEEQARQELAALLQWFTL